MLYLISQIYMHIYSKLPKYMHIYTWVHYLTNRLHTFSKGFQGKVYAKNSVFTAYLTHYVQMYVISILFIFTVKVPEEQHFFHIHEEALTHLSLLNFEIVISNYFCFLFCLKQEIHVSSVNMLKLKT